MTWEPVLLPLGAAEKTSAVVDADGGDYVLENSRWDVHTYIHKMHAIRV